MSLNLMADLLGLAVGWWMAWKVARHSLPAQNVLAIVVLAVGISALAHGYALLTAYAAVSGTWHAPAALGLVVVASRAVARRLGLNTAYHRSLIAMALTLPTLPSLLAMLLGQHSHKPFVLIWALGIGTCQLIVTPWWIRKSPAPENPDRRVAWLWIAINCYIGARAWSLGAPISGLFAAAAGIFVGWYAARARART